MHPASDGDKGLAYVQYVSDPEKYRHHFATQTMYDPSSFHLIGELDSMPMTGEGKASVKLISPTEGAVERAKEELKEEAKAKRIHSVVGQGRKRRGRPKSSASRTTSKGTKAKKKKKVGTKSKSGSKRVSKKGKVRKVVKRKGGRK